MVGWTLGCMLKGQTALLSSLDTEPADGHAHLTPPQIQSYFPGTQTLWISQFKIPWDKMSTSLSQTILRGKRANPADRRAMVRTVVAAMQEQCPNPNSYCVPKNYCVKISLDLCRHNWGRWTVGNRLLFTC